jgi:hypothetical protein
VQQPGGVGDKRDEFFRVELTLFENFLGFERLGVIQCGEDLVFVINDFCQLFFEGVEVGQVCDSYGKRSADFVGVTWADTSYGGSDFVFPERVFTKLVFGFVVIEDEMCVLAYEYLWQRENRFRRSGSPGQRRRR